MHPDDSAKPNFSLKFRSSLGWAAMLGFSLFTAVCPFVGLARVLNLFFPLGALAVAVLLYFRYPLLYNGFTWWIWFLSPLVRRYVDYRSSFTNPSPILLTPYAVTLVALITFFRVLPAANQRSIPFIFSCSGVLYGYLVGVIKSSPVAATIGLLDWLSPLIFGFHLFVNWRNYPGYRQNTQRVFLWFVLIAGAYGIFQYLVAPEWDRYWLENVTEIGNTSFGRPEPLEIRVWSIMHGPGVFGFGMFAGLLLLLSSMSPFILPATAVGYLSFLLSQVRSAWLGWATGLLFLVTGLKPKFQMRLLLVIIIASLCVLPLTTIEPFSEVISDRLETFSNVETDESAADRQENYARWLRYGVLNVLGDGIGSTRDVLLDSAILDSLISLGGFGTLLYLAGIVALLAQLAQSGKMSKDPFASTARAIAFSISSQAFLGSIMVEFPGMLLWSFLSLGLAAKKYYLHQAELNSEVH